MMKPSRTTRLLAAVLAVISLLFTQLALASYVCPAQAKAGMEHCAGMDKQQPTLCHSHDKVDKQSLDKPNLPQVQPFVAMGPALVVVPLGVARPPLVPVDNSFLTRATAPPLAIRHCCFRI